MDNCFYSYNCMLLHLFNCKNNLLSLSYDYWSYFYYIYAARTIFVIIRVEDLVIFVISTKMFIQ